MNPVTPKIHHLCWGVVVISLPIFAVSSAVYLSFDAVVSMPSAVPAGHENAAIGWLVIASLSLATSVFSSIALAVMRRCR
jgi:hypothetical protein